MLKSINEESCTSSERKINPDKTSKERGGFTKSDVPSTGPTMPSNKSLTTKTSYVDSGAGVARISSAISMTNTPKRSNGKASLD